ncbi:MAG TPA: hypothetical protein VF173_16210 [Thermoanaerobaculia bacterium]|nr:hypothetical protein [Thermoanaerobaculia bacterium]
MAPYLDADREGADREPRILVRIALGPLESPVLALMDTAAPWCVFRPEMNTRLQKSFLLIPGQAILGTRLGLFQGSLYRGHLRLLAEEGESLNVEATVFVSPDWPGPNFLGYQGLLQRIRFAVDPENNHFYFGEI